MLFNIYCDESCHLPNDGSNKMVIGGIWCPNEKVREITNRIKDIKKQHGITHEMKWVKLSRSKERAYLDLINYFFDDDDLHFRVVIVENKDKIDNSFFNQTQDDFYYKCYFRMLYGIIEPSSKYNIYLDIKDTKSKTKIRKLVDVLSNSNYDFSHSIINNMQVVRSDEIEIMQIVDILIGAMSYYARALDGMESKLKVIDLIKHRSKADLSKNSFLRESKFNVFHLTLQEVVND